MTDLLSYAGLFFSALIAATILPMQSEAVLTGLLVSDTFSPVLLVVVASLGNILGSVINWFIGRGIENYKSRSWFPCSDNALAKAQLWYGRYGKWSLLLSWLPVVGDPLTVIAGTMREPIVSFVLLIAIGKVGRYVALTVMTLNII